MILQGYNLHVNLVLGNLVKMQKSTKQLNKQTKKRRCTVPIALKQNRVKWRICMLLGVVANINVWLTYLQHDI